MRPLLRDEFPNLAAQLVDQTLLSTLTSGSGQKLEWQCADGHRWTSKVSNRVHLGNGCPYCSGYFALPGVTDLATTHPELAAQLIDRKLGEVLRHGSPQVVRWRCSIGHEYASAVKARTRGGGCPYCSGRSVLVGFNDLATVRPELAAQLAEPALASRLTEHSNKKVEWRCEAITGTINDGIHGEPTTTHDFGAGPVPAHQHPKGGGWVADTATVHSNVYVGPNARIAGGTIRGGELHGGLIVGGTINGGTINGGEIVYGIITGGTINGGRITGGLIHGGVIHGGTITGGTINAGTIHGGHITGGTISTGSHIHGGRIHGGYLANVHVHGGSIWAGKLGGGTINGGTIDGSTNLAGGVINDGTITGGHIDGGVINNTDDVLAISPIGPRNQVITVVRHGDQHIITASRHGLNPRISLDDLTNNTLTDNLGAPSPEHAAEHAAAAALIAARITRWGQQP